MERQQTGQAEKLMEVMVEKGGVDVFHQPGGSPFDRRGCFKCVVALATVMGLVIVALVVCFFLYVFMITPSTNQDDPRPSDTTKVSIVREIKSSNGSRVYDVFTVERSANYAIFGWLELSNISSEDSVKLMQEVEGDSYEIPKGKADKWTVYAAVLLLTEGSKIRLHVNSAHTSGKFHVDEVC